MSTSVPLLEQAFPDLLALLHAVGRPFRLVGGVAVIHHGYVRATPCIEVLVTGDHGLDPWLETFGFQRVGPARLRHRSGTPIDLLLAGTPSPRAGENPWPEPDTLAASPRAPEVVGLEGLVLLKLSARRAQERADIVALLKGLEDARYLALEAAMPAPKRRALAALRDEALEEMAMLAASHED